jgi:hypothetical protein
MGYTTDFEGEFKLDKTLTVEHANYLLAFNFTRRMKRHALKAAKLADPIREAAGLPVGDSGGYYVGGARIEKGNVVDAPGNEGFGMAMDPSVVDINVAPFGQPGLWCQWVPTEDRKGIAWDGGEKFYSYEGWLRYLIKHFLKPWGYKLNGEVRWMGEESSDRGTIVVKDNVVTMRAATINW